MATGILHLHNLLRWVIVLLVLLSIVKAFTGWQSKRVFTAGDKRVWLFTLIFSHINFLVGIYLLLLGPYGALKADLPEGTSIMKDKFLRFFWIEHPVMMLLSIVFVTIGYGMSKKGVSDTVKFRKAFWFFLIAFILILAAVPWPFREIVGRPWFPGM
ncbi:MAG: hypothetical protein EOO09_21250 [Chitinophagaceae bacterium]|nr:MAG: hypothetical protein EOO09_21250 [Chitinophagaceae bacterium]